MWMLCLSCRARWFDSGDTNISADTCTCGDEAAWVVSLAAP